ncbi:PA2169 family four-helix-bundle protein [Sphingobacterium sp. lm-10]|uniref:PA2169 family four-helix-bundle protein n=1 Tax=Sphingobacterium sp. lm-10 TaxID=2944904 RepID=UPI002021785E|nr:PA2169 family four-helix-bundle protein [Sphingobacterium sp. lm-10]MCL7989299.1 PA2169 family four-helix-bundle protein [Sphingobacterium sp. lm-10]
MQQSTREPLDILHDLVKINNDRMEGYTKAIELLPGGQHTDLRKVFEMYRGQSHDFKEEITPLVLQIGQGPIDGTPLSGKIFRAWMSLKAALSSTDRASILELAERGEDEFTSAYTNFLENEIGEDNPIRQMVLRQSQEQRSAHEHIKMLRDNARVNT